MTKRMTWRWGKPQRYLTPLPDDVRKAFEEDITSPYERLQYMRKLREAGWTLRAIADAAGVSNSLVAYAARHGATDELAPHLQVPTVPRYPDRPAPPAPPKLPDAETTARLRELMGFAQQVRGNTKRGRAEAEEFTALLDRLTREGITLYQLAKLLGTTRAALHGRLVRYGYRTTTGSSVIYTPVKDINRH